VETCKPTTHENPTFVVDGVVHYCVANMPGAVARSSTYALTNATLPYAKRMVELGVENAIRQDPALALGVNTYKGPSRTRRWRMPWQGIQTLSGLMRM